MKALTQKRLFSRKEFLIQKNSILIKQKTWREYLEFDLHFDQIGFKLFKKKDRGPFLALVFFSILTIMMGYAIIESILLKAGPNKIGVTVGLFLFMLLFSIMALLSMKNTLIYIVGGEKVLEFFHDSPSQEEVNQFINYIIALKKERIKSQVLKTATEMPEDYLESQLEWLVENEIIDEKEFNGLKEEYRIKRIIGSDNNE